MIFVVLYANCVINAIILSFLTDYFYLYDLFIIKNTLMLLTSNFLMSVFSNDVNVFAASIRQFVSI